MCGLPPSVNNFLCLLQYLLTQMREMGIPPDGLTYGALITAYAAAKQPRKAAAVMQEFVDSGGKVTCNSGLTATFTALVHLLIELSSSEHARLCPFWGQGELQLWSDCYNHCPVTFPNGIAVIRTCRSLGCMQHAACLFAAISDALQPADKRVEQDRSGRRDQGCHGQHAPHGHEAGCVHLVQPSACPCCCPPDWQVYQRCCHASVAPANESCSHNVAVVQVQDQSVN